MLDNMSGPEKAAILVLALGENFATQLMQNLASHEVHRLGALMTRTKDFSLEDVDAVIAEYHRRAHQSKEGIPAGGEDYVKRLIVNALGEEKARPIVEKLSSKAHNQVDLTFIRDIEPRNLVNFIKFEHPQTIALIMSYFSTAQAAEALTLLPETLRAEVMMRMANLDTVDSNMVGEIANAIEREVRVATGTGRSHKVSGLQTVAEIMNNLDKAVAGEIFEFLEEKDSRLSEGIRELMFVFEDLVEIDDRGLQAILKNVDNDSLIMALKTAGEQIKEKIFRNMSSRAAQMIEEEMEVMGPVRISEVEQAQKEIASVARKLEESGEIVMARGEGDIVV